MVVRISKGRFDPGQAAEVERLLRESEATLEPALRALPGLVAYHVGIDVAAGAMTNTSLWETRAHAMQMGSLRAMQELRSRFEALGVRFEEITNHEVLWSS
jgi:quinol monooxygenase YgiN